MSASVLPSSPVTARELCETDRGYVGVAAAPVAATPVALFAAGVLAGYALAEAAGGDQEL